MDNWSRKRFFALIFSFAGCLMALALAFARHHLSSRGLGIVGIVLMLTFWGIFTVFFYKVRARIRSAAPSPGTPLTEITRKTLQRRVRRLRLRVIVLPFCLLIIIFGFEDVPIAARLVVAMVNILLFSTYFRSMRRTQLMLKETGETP